MKRLGIWIFTIVLFSFYGCANNANNFPEVFFNLLFEGKFIDATDHLDSTVYDLEEIVNLGDRWYANVLPFPIREIVLIMTEKISRNKYQAILEINGEEIAIQYRKDEKGYVITNIERNILGM